MAALAAAAALALAALYVLWQAQREPANSPARVRRDGTRPLVVCAGASVTQGRMSADYVGLLERRLGGAFQFANAGRNGDLAYNLLQRLGPVVALRPDVVLLQIGTNDVNASLSPQLAARYRRAQDLPVLPTREFYRDNLAALVRRLRAETRAEVAVLSLPLLGEDLASTANQRVRAYNDVVREVAAVEKASYLPLYEAMAEALRRDPPPRPRPLAQYRVGVAMVQRYLLGMSYDRIGEGNGYRLLSDGIHLSGRGAAVMADVIEAHLTRRAVRGTEAVP